MLPNKSDLILEFINVSGNACHSTFNLKLYAKLLNITKWKCYIISRVSTSLW